MKITQSQLNILFISLLALAQLLFSPNAFSAEVKDGVTHITQQEFIQKVQESNVVVIDVRTEREYQAGYIKGAINLPHKSILKDPSLLEAYLDKEMIFYCHSGVRAKAITDYLIESDDNNKSLKLFHLKGDMRAWRARKLPIVTD